jgi:hypothetical protein
MCRKRRLPGLWGNSREDMNATPERFPRQIPTGPGQLAAFASILTNPDQEDQIGVLGKIAFPGVGVLTV